MQSINISAQMLLPKWGGMGGQHQFRCESQSQRPVENGRGWRRGQGVPKGTVWRWLGCTRHLRTAGLFPGRPHVGLSPTAGHSPKSSAKAAHVIQFHCAAA